MTQHCGTSLKDVKESNFTEDSARLYLKSVDGMELMLRRQLQEAKQEHLLAALDITAHMRRGRHVQLLQQIITLDIPALTKTFHGSVCPTKPVDPERTVSQPLPDACVAVPFQPDQPLKLSEDGSRWLSVGSKLIAEGKVAVVTLAGGQGTRLGSTLPKGMFDIGLSSHKTLFHMQAERLGELAEKMIKDHDVSFSMPWYIMTSDATHETTVKFFREKEFFGLQPESIRFFKQGKMPCFDMDGRILLDEIDTISMSPDGNGGIYRALVTEGILDDMKSRGIEHIHIYCVDNVLVKMADPVFIGYCASKAVEAGVKVVEKRGANEAVGVLVQKESDSGVTSYGMLEYSEMSADMANQKDDQDRLAYRHANIANHYFTRAFLEDVCTSIVNDASADSTGMIYHVAQKKIAYYDPVADKRVIPEKANGIKLEQFIFDIFAFLKSPLAVLQVSRSVEFSPLKNATGDDSPESCLRDLENLTAMLKEAK